MFFISFFWPVVTWFGVGLVLLLESSVFGCYCIVLLTSAMMITEACDYRLSGFCSSTGRCSRPLNSASASNKGLIERRLFKLQSVSLPLSLLSNPGHTHKRELFCIFNLFSRRCVVNDARNVYIRLISLNDYKQSEREAQTLSDSRSVDWNRAETSRETELRRTDISMDAAWSAATTSTLPGRRQESWETDQSNKVTEATPTTRLMSLAGQL